MHDLSELRSVSADSVSILILEDDDMLRSLLFRALEGQGYSVRARADGEAGIAALRQQPADIVLTDIRMQGMDGMEVLRRVRLEWPQTEVILLTGYATVEAAIEALRHGAYDLLLKPVRLEQIQTVIRNCVERIRYARENRELREVVDRLRELNERREKFVALTNHELRTPTVVASGIMGLLKKRASALAPEVGDLVERASVALGRLSEIVNDIGELAVSRSDADWLHVAPCSLADLCGDLEALGSEFRGLRDVEIECETHSDPKAVVWLDRAKVLRAVGGLVRNAVQFTPDGGRIQLGSHLDGDLLEISVTDNGVGIPPEEVPRIFDLFYKVGQPLSHHSSGYEFGGGGLGIGLPFARTVARAHGGDLHFTPRNGGGSVFTMELPANGKAAPASPA